MMQRNRKRFAGVFSVLLLFCLDLMAIPHVQGNGPNERINVRCVFINEHDGVRVLAMAVEPDAHRTVRPREYGQYTCTVVADDGSVMFSSAVHIPNRLYYDYPEAGQLRGGMVIRPDVPFEFDLPSWCAPGSLHLCDNSGRELMAAGRIADHLQVATRSPEKTGEANAKPVTVLQYSGDPSNRINIVFLADGYTGIVEPFTDTNGNGRWDGDPFVDLNSNGHWDSGEPFTDRDNDGVFDAGEPFQDVNGDGTYNADEQSLYAQNVDALVQAILGRSIFGGYSHHVNIYRIDSLVSPQSGADHLYTAPHILRNTFLDSYYSSSIARLLVTSFYRVDSIIRTSVPELDGRYTAMVLVNSLVYGGSGGSISVSYNGSLDAEVLVHEMGHTFGELADEYYYTTSEYTHYGGGEPLEPNVTTATERSRVKWNRWIQPETPIPTPAGTGGIGLFEGGQYYQTGIYRPRTECRMKSLNYQFCEVCSEAMIKQVCTWNDVIDAANPETDTVVWGGGGAIRLALSLIAPVPNTLKVDWYVNGVLMAEHGDSLSFVPSASAGQMQAVEVVVADTTAFVRHDTLGALKRTRRWYIKLPAAEVAEETDCRGQTFSLEQNYPNPFNPETSIKYNVGVVSLLALPAGTQAGQARIQSPVASVVRLAVYDILGREVAVLMDEKKAPGSYEVKFDGSKLATGVYVYRLTAGGATMCKKMMLVN